MGSLQGLTSSLTQSIYSSALQTTGVKQSGGSAPAASTSTVSGEDTTQLSPLAQLLSELQKLQQSDPEKYKELTGQIAKNLQTAAQADTAEGNTAGASQLNQLANDFQTASKTGQLPDVADLAQAIGGGTSPAGGHGGSSCSSTSSTSALSIISSTLAKAADTSTNTV